VRYRPWSVPLMFWCSLAHHEMRVILASLIWNFDFELCPISENWLDQKVHFLWAKSPLMVKVAYVR
jgi:hypothetical protein